MSFMTTSTLDFRRYKAITRASRVLSHPLLYTEEARCVAECVIIAIEDDDNAAFHVAYDEMVDLQNKGRFYTE